MYVLNTTKYGFDETEFNSRQLSYCQVCELTKHIYNSHKTNDHTHYGVFALEDNTY